MDISTRILPITIWDGFFFKCELKKWYSRFWTKGSKAQTNKNQNIGNLGDS